MESDYGSITAQTMTGASCKAQAVLPNGSRVGGLRNPQVADANGTVAWIYPQPLTQTGPGTSIVTCTYKLLSATAYGSFDVGS